MTLRLRRGLTGVGVAAGVMIGAAAICAPIDTAADPPFAPQQADAQAVLDALAAARPLDLGGAAVTGLVLPHHRVASDLIATGMLTAAQGARPSRILMLTPDHFKRGTRAFSTTLRDFDTALGRVPTDRRAAQALLGSPHVAASVLFEREHGVGELLPYVARLFPGVPVLPVALSIHSTRAQWDHLVERLAPWFDTGTLIVQSTDFSHYLPREQAVVHDQQMLNVLAAGDLDALARARQPAHIDSRAAQYVQMRLQQRRFGALPIVYGNRNSADTGATGADDTTSYVAQVYAPAARDHVVLPGDSRTLCVAGDTFFGRHVAHLLRQPPVRERVLQALRAQLRGCPLLVNLEGVLSADGHAAHPLQLAMPRDETLRWLRELGVVAVGVANNHARDLGDTSYAEMTQALRAAGFVVLEHGRVETVGPLRVTAWRDLDNRPVPRAELLGADELARAEPTDIAFLHWGREFVAEPGERERSLSRQLRARAVPLIVGAHPHRASAAPVLADRSVDPSSPTDAWLDGVLVHSLGNFIFDQRGPRASGALLQVTVFAQGTRAVRLIPIADVFTWARGR